MKFLLDKYIKTYAGLSQESWMLSIVMLINRVGAMVIPFLGIYLHKELGFSVADSGKILSFFGVGALVGSWLGGWLTDKIGNYYVQVLSLFLCAPLHLILPFFHSFWAIAIILLLLGVISETFRPANSVAIYKYAKRENITRAFSLNRMAINLGFSIGPAVGGILSGISFNFLFYINALSCVIAGVVFMVFFRNRKERNEAIEESSVAAVQDRSPYKDGYFLLFTVFCTLFAVAFFQLLSTLPLFLEEGAKLNQSQIGLVLGYSGLIIVLMEMPLIAFVEKHMTIVQIMFWGTVVSGINYFLYTIDTSLFVVFLAISLMSIGEMLVLPFMSTVTALRSGPNSKGAYMGLNGISAGVALIITPILGTYVVEHYGYTVLWYATSIVLIVTAIGFKYSIAPMKEIKEADKSQH